MRFFLKSAIGTLSSYHSNEECLTFDYKTQSHIFIKFEFFKVNKLPCTNTVVDFYMDDTLESKM